VSLFIAIQSLQMVVATPIVTVLPSVVAGLWGIFLFKEIEGKKNIFMFTCGLVVSCTGVMFIASSK
jgi:glucose uptake protein GlcU